MTAGAQATSSPEPGFVRPLFEALDRQDARAAVTFLTPDARLRFANAGPVVGREAIGRSLDDFFGTVRGVRHELLGVWALDDVVVCELEVTYSMLDGRTISLPCVDIFRTRGGLIADYRVFIDVSPLEAA
jgi:ketosteroid isomerase-like protein